MNSSFTVQGMTCDHCIQAVTSELTKIAGVHHVSVDLESGTVAVESDAALDPDAVAAAIEEAGYELAG